MIPNDITDLQTEQLLSAWRKIFGKLKCNITITDIFHTEYGAEIRINEQVAIWPSGEGWQITAVKKNTYMPFHSDYFVYAIRNTWVETVSSVIALFVELKTLKHLMDDPDQSFKAPTPNELFEFLCPPTKILPNEISPFLFSFTPHPTNMSESEISDILDEHGLNVFDVRVLSPKVYTIGVSIKADKLTSAESFIHKVLCTAGLSGNLQQYTQM